MYKLTNIFFSCLVGGLFGFEFYKVLICILISLKVVNM